MSRLSIFLLAPLAIVSCEMHLALAQTTAVSANDFLNSIGVVSLTLPDTCVFAGSGRAMNLVYLLRT